MCRERRPRRSIFGEIPKILRKDLKLMKNKTMQRIAKMIKPHIKSILIITILAIIINIGEIAKPYIVKIIIDDYLSLGIFEKGAITIATLGWIYISIVIVGNIINYIATTATNMLGEKVIYTLRNKLFIFTQKANITFHDKTSSGKLFVRITNDVEDVATLFKDVLATFMKDVVLIIAIIIIMCVLSIKLSMVSFIVLPFVILSSYIITKMLNKVYDFSKNIRTQVNTFLAETIYGLKLIKIFNRQKEKQVECERLTKDFLDSRKPTGILEGLLPALLTIFKNLGIAIIIWASVNAWFGIELQIGLVYMFVTYLESLFDPITRIVENMEVVQESVVSINKIYDILDEVQYIEDLDKGIEMTTTKGKIEFRNVWFSYDNENWVLKNVSFTINSGESIAFVGKTGSRKNNNN